MSLTKRIAHVVDQVFNEEDALRAFRLLEAKDGISFRRYFRQGPYSECEVSIHRSKWWTAKGGEVFGELYCFIPEVQLAVYGVQQSWLAPAQGTDLFYVQFRTSGCGEPFEQSVAGSDDLAGFERGLRRWLRSVALPWLQQFESRQGVLEHVERKEDSYLLALLHAYFGELTKAKQSTARFLAGLPRSIEGQLVALGERGLVSAEDKGYLLKASIQSSEEYGRRVQTWLEKQEA
jgi:hypothetical protein